MYLGFRSYQTSAYISFGYYIKFSSVTCIHFIWILLPILVQWACLDLIWILVSFLFRYRSINIFHTGVRFIWSPVPKGFNTTVCFICTPVPKIFGYHCLEHLYAYIFLNFDSDFQNGFNLETGVQNDTPVTVTVIRVPHDNVWVKMLWLVFI